MESGGKEYIDQYIERAKKAQYMFKAVSQEDTDAAVKAIAKVIYDNAEFLAELAVAETGMGNVPDKTLKNRNKAKIIWNSLRGVKSKGVIGRDTETGITKIAKPIGVVGAVTPTTNPIVTPMSNAMFALKGGNAIVIAPHPRAKGCSGKTVELMRAELKKLDFPEDLIQMIPEPTIELTNLLMKAVDVVIATGGMGMVKAVYSSGKPALGVGAGNVQAIIDRDADITDAVAKITSGRAFDNGIICSGEQTAIYPAEMRDEIMNEFEKNGALIVRDAETVDKFRKALFDDDGVISKHAIGQPVQTIGSLAGVSIPENIKVIVLEAKDYGTRDLLAREKMCPAITAYAYGDFEEAVEIAKANLEVEGKGHSVAIHSNNVENIEYAAKELCVSRFVINQSCAGSAGGSFFNGLSPTNTLGCGSWGNNSISENLTWYHLVNISRVAYYMPENHVPDDGELWG